MSKVFRVSKCPNETLALTNCLIVHPRDFDLKTRYVIVDGQFYFNIKPAEGVAQGEIGTSVFHRKYASLSLNQEVQLKIYDPSSENLYLASINAQVYSFYKGRLC